MSDREGHTSCPYSEEQLQEWDSVCNPMGAPCNDCLNYDCEHNPNPSPCEIYIEE